MTDMRSSALWARIGDSQGTGFECRWATSRTRDSQYGDSTPLQAIDVFFLARPGIPCPPEIDSLGPCEILLQSEKFEAQVLTADILGSENALGFLYECLQAAIKAPSREIVTARFIIPLQSGTIIRSDIVPYRLGNAFWVEKASSFARPLQVFPGSLLSLGTVSLAETFRASAGAILLKPGAIKCRFATRTGFPIRFHSEVEPDFEDKFSTPWISAEPITRKRLILVGSSNQDPDGGGWTQFAHRAAQALGIDLVIIDREDGWLGQGNYGSWYEALLIAPSSWWAAPSADGLVKIVEEYTAKNKGKRIDGLATFIEALQAPVSVAASRLGFPHELTSAFERATNKYNLGLFQNRPAFLASNAGEVLSLIESPQNQLRFPLIVKPCFGLNSEGVTRVDKASELDEAIDAARKSGRSKSEVGDRVLVERYCEGPEVDVNMVFVDGEVLFSEICDDFPKGADLDNSGNNTDGMGTAKVQAEPENPDAGQRRNFQETNMVFPSALPDNELTSLRNAVKKTIQGLGFKNGVMHVEARIANSSCSYQSAGGIVDLRPRQTTNTEGAESIMDTPVPWVIEVNPRPPGLFASQTPVSVYGIDYWGISLLLGVGDKARATALSRPFANGAQSHTVLVMIRAEFDPACEGIFDSGDVCAELLVRHPDLKQHLGRYGCLLKRGQKIPHPREGRNTFVAYLNVTSWTSRQEALDIATKVREEIRYEIR
ncbi:putative glutathione synthetase ATP-binding domain-like protein [Rosellinia necatrix]|uniref:Putative glutathione synthetase ATP-binding domain-like protein n=1 Tax=Rosellinia necatrix TaxID=77044 RepID=A0A1S7UL73_ROSNE|nr:putative glutathione synthetase ATP-binding domain-like protein [Rosellinia necatrix]